MLRRALRATVLGGALASSISLIAIQAPPQKFVPAPPVASDLTVRLDRVGRIGPMRNPTSPVSFGEFLVFIDQAGSLYAWKDGVETMILDDRMLPRDLKPLGQEAFLNVAVDAPRRVLYMLFLSATAPAAIPRRQSPRIDSDGWYVLHAFAFDEGMRVASSRAITALQMRTEGHTGGGLAVLPDGSVLVSVGDNGDSYEDGGTFAQDPAVHLSKIIRVNPATGATSVAATGVRSAQRLIVSGDGPEARVSFVDPGGWVSEELNSVLAADMLSPNRVPNFGWGRGADGRSREGTFAIDKVGNSTGRITSPEPDVVDPVAEFGRGDATAVAASGPVASAKSFSRITMLIGDLVSGSIYAVTNPPATRRQTLHVVTLVDDAKRVVTLKQLAGNARPDPRFFNFPDGSAGVLLERTGDFFRITEVTK